MNKRATTLAHGWVDILNNTLVFNSLEDAIEGIDFIIGTTAKRRSAKYDYYDCNEIVQIIDRNMNLYHRIIERMMVLQEEDIHLLNSISNKYLERK